MSLAVVGARYPNRDGSNRRFEILLCETGEPVDLRPEPKNKRDERAVAVYSTRGVQIGYLTAERCGRIGGLIREGRELQAVFQAPSPFGAWIRVAFDGEGPSVEDRGATEDAPEEPDFYPDEIWPDD
ncbi:HIRAN domain-containing protein [Pelagerythrobacter marinus]|uniref:HIRAN domain-containing protein n=1 Tax=Pelagerythrobacter marinus TaxID=538382 RepID=UPI002AC95DD2|nr:HIRAN domain-containing protein [Pelagerythrobacter marinus]WPZ06613.1 HIRAN domain-containing protein [Pelagerythrobacter marinus]